MYCNVIKLLVSRLGKGSAKSPLAPSVLDLYGLAHAMLYVKWVANTILTTGTHCTTRGLGSGSGGAAVAAAEENAKLRLCTKRHHHEKK